MADPTLYLFDGYNVLHAGSFSDPRELVDQLASFVALKGAVRDLEPAGQQEERPHRLAERLDRATRDRLERLRRNRSG